MISFVPWYHQTVGWMCGTHSREEGIIAVELRQCDRSASSSNAVAVSIIVANATRKLDLLLWRWFLLRAVAAGAGRIAAAYPGCCRCARPLETQQTDGMQNTHNEKEEFISSDPDEAGIML